MRLEKQPCVRLKQGVTWRFTWRTLSVRMLPSAMLSRRDASHASALTNQCGAFCRRKHGAVCARVAAYKGSVALGQAHAEVLRALDQANIPIIATVLGNPYVLPRMPERATTLLTFESAVESEEAAVRVISGEVPARGRSPVALLQEH